jgi:hypothetical protein
MSRKGWLLTSAVIQGLVGVWLYIYFVNRGDPRIPKQVVFEGDSQEHVIQLLGEPNIEFPRGGTLVQWRAGSEVVLSNGYVVAVEMLPIETEEERFEREMSILEDEKRLEDAYQAAANQEKISYQAWLDREAMRLLEEQRELKKVQSYKKRREAQRKAAIRAEALRRSRRRCGY